MRTSPEARKSTSSGGRKVAVASSTGVEAGKSGETSYIDAGVYGKDDTELTVVASISHEGS